MARTRRIKKTTRSHYHVISRTNNKIFLFDREDIKTDIVDILKRVAVFSGIKLEAYCLMDNHFHVVCEVEKPEKPVPENVVLDRIAILKSGEVAQSIAEHWAYLRKIGAGAAVEEDLNRWRRRMNDVSQFTKTFKELINIRYKRRTKHVGSLWSSRFTSTLIEDGRYLATCIRYVELNPVRAGIVTQSKNYRWNSHNSTFGAVYTAFAGTVPLTDEETERYFYTVEDVERHLKRRMVQLGEGKILGSRAFVASIVGELEAKLGWHPAPKKMGIEMYATHGFMLAAEEEAKRAA